MQQRLHHGPGLVAAQGTGDKHRAVEQQHAQHGVEGADLLVIVIVLAIALTAFALALLPLLIYRLCRRWTGGYGWQKPRDGADTCCGGSRRRPAQR